MNASRWPVVRTGRERSGAPERFTAALTARITAPAVGALPVLGAVDQFVDSTDVLSHAQLARAATRATLTDPAR